MDPGPAHGQIEFLRQAGGLGHVSLVEQQQVAVGEPSSYVLEVNGGWCKQHGVVAGAKESDRDLEASVSRLVELARTLFAAEERVLEAVAVGAACIPAKNSCSQAGSHRIFPERST